jgi:hypothetical protein
LKNAKNLKFLIKSLKSEARKKVFECLVI